MKRVPIAVPLTVWLLLVATAGCGGSGSDGRSSASSTAPPTSASAPATSSPTTAASAPQSSGAGPCVRSTAAELRGYLGLTLAGAQARAHGEGRVVRVVGEDGACKLVTMDYSHDRVDLDLAHGVVVAASIG